MNNLYFNIIFIIFIQQIICSYASATLGSIIMWPGTVTPSGQWLFCQGQLLEIANYPELFNILGTNYGGDGNITFAIPDLRGRTTIGSGCGTGLTAREIGDEGGTEDFTLLLNQLPSHTHGIVAVDVPSNYETPGGGKVLGVANANIYF